jgi:hypothetical protein
MRGQLLLANTPQLPHSDQGNFSCQTDLAPMLVPRPVPGSELDRGATRTSDREWDVSFAELVKTRHYILTIKAKDYTHIK